MLKLLSNETLRHFSWRTFQILLKNGTTFTIFAITAKLLSPEDFGLFNYIITFVFLLLLFCDFGISTSVSKYTTNYTVTNDLKQHKIVSTSIFLVTIISLTVSVFVLFLGESVLKSNDYLLPYILPLILLISLSSVFDGIYRGRKRFKALALITLFSCLISLISVFPLIYEFNIEGSLLAQIVLFGALTIIFIFDLRKEIKFSIDYKTLIDILKYSSVYGIAIAGNYLFIRAGILVLGHYNYLNEIAVYELLNRILMIFILPFSIFGQVLAPVYSALEVQKNFKTIYTDVLKYTIIFIPVGIFLGALFFFMLPPLIEIFFPEYYSEILFDILPYVILIFVSNIWSATIDAGILVPAGFASLMAWFYTALGSLSFVASLILVVDMGYLGVIISFAFSSLIMSIGLRTVFILKLLRLIK